MKAIKTLLLVAVVAILGALPAQAGGMFKIGPRVGLTVNEMHFNKSAFDDKNRTGWTAGVMTEFRVPIIGLGFDLSAMYVRRNSSFLTQQGLTKNDRDYFEIPLNLRYNLSLPVVGSFLTPYVAVGPSVSFLTSRKNIDGADNNGTNAPAYRNKGVDWALNFGIGVQLVKHLDISARYGLGLTNTLKAAGVNTTNADIKGKNRYWTISAAWLF